MPKLAWITPDILPGEMSCRTITVPEQGPWLAALLGAISELLEPENWEQYEGVTPEEAVEVFEEVWYSLEAFEPCPEGAMYVYYNIGVTKPSGDPGGAATGGALNYRDLTEFLFGENDDFVNVNLVTNIIQIANCEFHMRFSATAYRVGMHRALLVDDYGVVGLGDTARSNTTDGDNSQSRGQYDGEAIERVRSFKLATYPDNSQAGNGLGRESGFGYTELYGNVEIWRKVT